jgi:hypothetical protein
VTTRSSSIKLSKEGTISFFSLSFNSMKLQNGMHKWLANDHETSLEHKQWQQKKKNPQQFVIFGKLKEVAFY